MKIISLSTPVHAVDSDTFGGWREPKANEFSISVGSIEYDGKGDDKYALASKRFATERYTQTYWRDPSSEHTIANYLAIACEHNDTKIDFLRFDGHGDVGEQTVGDRGLSLDTNTANDFAQAIAPFIKDGAHLQLGGCAVAFGPDGHHFLLKLRNAFLQHGKNISIEAKTTPALGSGYEALNEQGAFVELDDNGFSYRGGGLQLSKEDVARTNAWMNEKLRESFPESQFLFDYVANFSAEELTEYSYTYLAGALFEIDSGPPACSYTECQRAEINTFIRNAIESFNIDDEKSFDARDVMRMIFADNDLRSQHDPGSHRLYEFEGYELVEDMLFNFEDSEDCD